MPYLMYIFKLYLTFCHFYLNNEERPIRLITHKSLTSIHWTHPCFLRNSYTCNTTEKCEVLFVKYNIKCVWCFCLVLLKRQICNIHFEYWYWTAWMKGRKLQNVCSTIENGVNALSCKTRGNRQVLMNNTKTHLKR